MDFNRAINIAARITFLGVESPGHSERGLLKTEIIATTIHKIFETNFSFHVE